MCDLCEVTLQKQLCVKCVSVLQVLLPVITSWKWFFLMASLNNYLLEWIQCCWSLDSCHDFGHKLLKNLKVCLLKKTKVQLPLCFLANKHIIIIIMKLRVLMGGEWRRCMWWMMEGGCTSLVEKGFFRRQKCFLQVFRLGVHGFCVVHGTDVMNIISS